MKRATMTITSGLDSLGRARFTLRWPDDSVPGGIRGQCFHAVPEEHARQMEAKGYRVTIQRDPMLD